MSEEKYKMIKLSGLLNESYVDQYLTTINKIQKQPQAQFSTNDQLKVCIVLAQRFGLYDAADVIKKFTK